MAPTAAPTGVSVRVRADKSGGSSAHAADLPGAPPGTWPFAGVEFVDTFQRRIDPPAELRLAEGFVAKAITAGWVEAEGHEVHTRPAGPAGRKWDRTEVAPNPHVFHHYTALVFKTVDGEDDVRYRVTHNPDKYAEDGDDDTPVTDEVYDSGATRVDWFYDLTREG